MFLFTENIEDNYYYYILILAFIYYILTQLTIIKLIAIIILIIVFFYINNNIQVQKNINEKKELESKDNLKNDIKNIKEINTSNFYIKETPKNIKFLSKNNELLLIIKNIRFIKKFNKTRYTSLITNLDKLMKIYIYILADRYDLNTFLPIFNDIKAEILELFYSLIFVIPSRFKHIYGFDPHNEINKSRDSFLIVSNNMLNVLKKYGTIEKKEVYLNIQKYKPYEKNKELYLP